MPLQTFHHENGIPRRSPARTGTVTHSGANGPNTRLVRKSGGWRMVLVLIGLFWFGMLSMPAGDAPYLDPHFEPLRPLLGKTLRGELRSSTAQDPQIDIARWERALNGRAVRVLHSINQGVYGGETIITWNEEKKSLVYHYFATAGFQTAGTMAVKGRTLVTHEFVSGSAQGITEVKATIELLPDGGMSMKSEYLKDGKWVSGHAGRYQVDPKAEVVFR